MTEREETGMVYASKMPPETGAQTERRNRVATSKEYIDFVLEQLEGIDAISCKKMFGEYLAVSYTHLTLPTSTHV